MSDYVRNKVVRIPFPQFILTQCDTASPWECEEYLEELLGELYVGSTRSKHFEITYTDESAYLDWVFYHTYGENSDDFGYARYLTNNEYTKIEPLFSKVIEEFNKSDLRLVDYCYYNGADPADCYEVEEEDDYTEELL